MHWCLRVLYKPTKKKPYELIPAQGFYVGLHGMCSSNKLAQR